MARDEPEGDPGRREVLTVSALGISTLLLPSATAAASLAVDSAAATAPVTYVAGDAPLASWGSFQIGSNTTPDGTTFAIPRDTDYLLANVIDAAGTNQRPNPAAFVGTGIITDGSIGYSGTSRAWRVRNTSPSIDHSSTPYVEYRLRVASDRAVEVRSLVLHSTTLGSDRDLNLAFFRSTDGFSTRQLVRTATPILANRKIVVGLDGIRIAGGETLTVRMYFYSTDDEAIDVFVNARNRIANPPREGLTEFDTAQPAEDPSVDPGPVELPEAAVSFVGQQVLVVVPS